MKEAEQWIVIRNWDQFQHYRDRSPVWIKNYTELLHDEAYLNLTASQRGLLHGLWLEYAMSRTCLPARPNLINGRLRLNIKMSSLKALRDAGFIEFSASSPLARRYQDASPEKRREEKRREEENEPSRSFNFHRAMENMVKRMEDGMKDDG